MLRSIAALVAMQLVITMPEVSIFNQPRENPADSSVAKTISIHIDPGQSEETADADHSSLEIPPEIFADTYYVLCRGKLYHLGKEGTGKERMMLASVNKPREMEALSQRFRAALKSGSERPKKLTLFRKSFKKMIVQSEHEQDMIISAMRYGTQTDGRERGCFIKLIDEGKHFSLAIEQQWEVGERNEYRFRFPSVNGEPVMTNGSKEVIIGTIHMHTHDRGLSGFYPGEEAGDVANVKQTSIPWITVGPEKIHAGFVGALGFQMETVTSGNIVLYCLQKSAL